MYQLRYLIDLFACIGTVLVKHRQIPSTCHYLFTTLRERSEFMKDDASPFRPKKCTRVPETLLVFRHDLLIESNYSRFLLLPLK